LQEQLSEPEAASKVYLPHCKRYTKLPVNELRLLLDSPVQACDGVFILYSYSR